MQFHEKVVHNNTQNKNKIHMTPPSLISLFSEKTTPNIKKNAPTAFISPTLISLFSTDDRLPKTNIQKINIQKQNMVQLQNTTQKQNNSPTQKQNNIIWYIRQRYYEQGHIDHPFPLRPKSQYNILSEIPKKVFQTWKHKNLPTHMHNVRDQNMKDNPEFEFILFDDADCSQFIYSNFSDDVIHAYESIIPGAFKADLWRACILYVYGGIYIDIKFRCHNGFRLYALLEKEHFVIDRPIEGTWETDYYGIYNAFMVCKPRNEYLLTIINNIVKNVKERSYGFNALYPTGPGLYGKVILKNIKHQRASFNDHELYFSRKATHIQWKQYDIFRIYPEYRQEQQTMLELSGERTYMDLWGSQQVYRDFTLSPYPMIHVGEPVIPLRIYQTWNTKHVPPGIAKCLTDLRDANPELEHILFDDDDCRTFIESNFDKLIVDTFDKLIPGAFKADLWRYCILYIQGGIYLDIKYRCINNFRFIALTDKEYFVQDIEDSGKGCYNALMVCKPGNSYVLQMIYKCVENVQSRFYGKGPLEITGPNMLKTVFTESEINAFSLCHKDYDNKFYIYDTIHRVNILTIDDTYRAEQLQVQGNNRYGDLWRARRVYKD